MTTFFNPPFPLPDFDEYPRRFSVFLAGSIEMGSAPNWQAEIERNLADLDIDIFNPRRDDWDSSWVQSADNPQFRQQVEWKLDGLSRAKLIAMYLAPGTVSPISLLELGLFASEHYCTGKSLLVVCCPEGFQRKGNVDIVCERYGVPQVVDLADLEKAIRSHHTKWLGDLPNW